MTEKLPLPVGVSDYRLASEEYYYVDKTLMLKTFLDERPMVSLFTRPRRFGKTLNMDMLRTYFEKTDEDTSVYFKDKKIWECGERYRSYQGKYPVIFLTFKDVKFQTWKETIENIRHILQVVYLFLVCVDYHDIVTFFNKLKSKGASHLSGSHNNDSHGPSYLSFRTFY